MFETDYKERTMKSIWGSLVKFIFVLAVNFGVCEIISIILNRRGSLKGYSGTVFNKMILIILIAIAVVYVIHQELQNTKINNALKRKQNLNK